MLDRNEIYSLANYGEVIAGSDDEKKITYKIKSLMEEIADEVRLDEIRVMNWKVRNTRILLDEKEVRQDSYVILPYSPSCHEEGLVDKDFMFEHVDALSQIPFVYERCINDVRCKALFITLDEKLRKFVIKSPPLLQRGPSMPPSKPVVYIRRSYFDMFRKSSRLCLDVDAVFTPYSTGTIIEGILNGQKDQAFYVSAHHDHWFHGFRDNMSSVIALLGVKGGKYERHLLSFTAEESGSPYFSSWSWSYGSYEFTKRRESELERAVLNINLDNIDTNTLETIYTPGLSPLTKGLKNSKAGFDPYNDGYSFVKTGIPSIMIESRNSPVYHSDEDVLDESILSYATEDLAYLINRILNNAENTDFLDRDEISSFVKESYTYINTEMKSYLVNFPSAIKTDINAFRSLLKMVGTTTSLQEKGKVSLFPVLYAIKDSSKETIDVEGFGRIEKIKDNGYGLAREYLIYLDSIKEKISEIYIDEIYNSLKKFF